LLPPTDRAYAALIDDLGDRGLLDSTLVIAMGEFGRTPKVNANAGRDHWPYCFSVVLAGGGIRGGTVFGASDKLGAYPDLDAVTPSDLAATPRPRFVTSPAVPIASPKEIQSTVSLCRIDSQKRLSSALPVERSPKWLVHCTRLTTHEATLGQRGGLASPLTNRHPVADRPASGQHASPPLKATSFPRIPVSPPHSPKNLPSLNKPCLAPGKLPVRAYSLPGRESRSRRGSPCDPPGQLFR